MLSPPWCYPPAAVEGLLMIYEWPNSRSVFQDLVQKLKLGQRKIIMGSQISLMKVTASLSLQNVHFT